MALLLTFALLALVAKGRSYAAAIVGERGTTGIDPNLFSSFQLMSEYSAAAYCSNNHDSPNTKVTCASNVCPLVQSATTNTLTEFESQAGTDVTGYVAVDDTNRLVVVSFRGSHSIKNWMANLDLSAVQTDLCNGCTAHSGFWRSWVDARKGVLAAVKIASNSHPDYELVATGHSLGGAIATLAAAQLRNDGYNTTLYTFGAPRVASATLSSYITKQAGGNYRITHWNDPVPRLPPLWMNYVHISPEYYINRPTFALVSATDLKTYTGSVNLLGNAAWIVTDVGAHLWYMLSICGCSVTNVLTGRDPQKHAEIVAKF